MAKMTRPSQPGTTPLAKASRSFKKVSVAVDPVSIGMQSVTSLGEAIADYKKTKVRADADVKVAAWAAVAEGLRTVQKAIGYFENRDEWNGRVAIAQKEVDKARLEYESDMAKHDNDRESIKQLGKARDAVIQLLQQATNELNRPSLTFEQRAQLRDQAVSIAAQLAAIR